MSLKSKLKGAWEERKADRERSKKLEEEIYEKKKYAIEMGKEAEQHKRVRETAEKRAEFRATGGYGGALKRGAKQTGRGLVIMGKGAIKKYKSQPKKSGRSRSSDPFSMGGGFGFGDPAPKRRNKSRSRSSGGNITINLGGPNVRSSVKRRSKRKKSRKADPLNIFGGLEL